MYVTDRAVRSHTMEDNNNRTEDDDSHILSGARFCNESTALTSGLFGARCESSVPREGKTLVLKVNAKAAPDDMTGIRRIWTSSAGFFNQSLFNKT